jgi:dienelactone hydrolase
VGAKTRAARLVGLLPITVLLQLAWLAPSYAANAGLARQPDAPTQLPTSSLQVRDVTFVSGDLELRGLIVAPDGDGPFPAILWNHGSERYPGTYFTTLAQPFVSAGYVVFMPFRRGQGTSPGPYINVQVASAPPSQRNQLQVQLLQDQLADQLAGLAYLQTQPFVDTKQISVMGGSYGGIQTLLGAAANPGYVAAVDCSGAAESWQSNPLLQSMLEATAGKIEIPVFLLAAQNDYDLTPEHVLGPLLQAQGNPAVVKVYPPFGTGAFGQAGHNMCFIGSSVWANDAISFITNGSVPAD